MDAPVAQLFLEDAFGVHRVLANRVVDVLAEAWSQEQKEQIESRMAAQGFTLVEHVVFADYDLALWRYRDIYYAASINSGSEDPTTMDGQASTPKAQSIQWNKVTMQLRHWVRQYGKILIASSQVHRMDQYRRLLSRYFLIGDWNEYPGHGFFIMPD